MDAELICENKFKYGHRTIALPVKLENLPDSIVVEGHTLFLKNSFHVSLICIGKIIEKHEISISDFENKIINDFCEFSKTNDIRILKYSDYKFAARDELKTVIVMCEVSNLYTFFKIINTKYRLEIEYPPTHVTLYAHDGKTGIFLTDSNNIKNLTKEIPNPIGRPL